MTIHVSLPEELENLVHAQVASGMYKSASEVVREALRDFFSARTPFSAEQSQWIQQEMSARLEAIKKGSIELLDGETVFRQIETDLG